MPSRTLSYIRNKYPQWENRSDEELTLAVGEAYPDLLGNDSEFASEYNSYKNPQGFVENFAKSAIASTVFDNAAAGFGVLETVSKPFSDEMSKWMRQLSDRAAEEGAELRETGDIAFGIGFDRGVNQDAWASKLGSGAGSLVPMLVTGGAGAAVGLTARAASVAGMAVATLQSYGSTYQQARKGYEQQGLPVEEAASKATLPAAAQATLDAVLMGAGGKVANKLGLTDLEKLATTLRSKPVRESVESVAKASGLKRLVGSGVVEGAEEGASGFIGSYVIARHSYDPTVTLEESIGEAWDSFTVGGALGSAGDVARRVIQPKSPEELARRNTIRKVAPATAAKLDENDARNALIPDEAVVATDTRAEAAQRSVTVDTERGKIVEEAREDGKLPLWWDRYDSEGVDSSGEVPTGLRYADQETVDKFIETQEAYNEFLQFQISETEGGFEVYKGDKSLTTTETKEEADQFVRQAAVSAAPESVRKQIEAYKQLTRTLSAIDEREKRYKTTLETSKQQQSERDSTVEQPVSDEDMQFAAQALGIPAEELPFTGIAITQQMVDELRFAPETGLTKFIQQAEAQRELQAEQVRQIPVQVSQELRAQEAEVENLKNQARAITSRIEALPDSERTELPASTPRSSQDLSEFVEIALAGGSLNQTQRLIVEKLQDRKSALIVGSIGETNPDTVDATIAEIEAIDRNLANVLPVSITPPSGLLSYQDLQQMQQLVSEPPRPKAMETDAPPVIVVDGVSVSGGELSSDLSSKLNKAIKAVEKRFGSKMGLRRIVIRKMQSGAGVASAVRSGITDAVFVDPERLEASLKNKRFKLDKAIEEEMLHNLDGQALTLEYARLIGDGTIQKGTTLQQFINDYFTDIAVKMTPAEVKAARKIYGEDFIDPVHQAQEFVRQLIQKKHTNEVTEDAYRSPFIRTILEALSNMLVKLNLSKGAKAHLDRVEKFLMDAYQSEIGEAITTEDKRLAKVPVAQRNDVASRDIEVEPKAEPAVEANATLYEDAGDDWPLPVVEAVSKAYAENSYEMSVDLAMGDLGISLDATHKDFAINNLIERHVKQLKKSLETGDNEWSWVSGRNNAVKDALKRQSAQKRGGDYGQISLDAPAGGEGSATVGELVPDVAASPEKASVDIGLSDMERLEKLFEELDPIMEEAGLTEKEKIALRGKSAGMALGQIAELLGMSDSSIASASKWVSKASTKLYAYLQNDANSDKLELFYQIAREGAARTSDPLTYASSPKVSLIANVLSKIPDKRKALLILRRKGFLKPSKIEVPGQTDEYVNIYQKKIDSDAYINSRTNVINQTDRRLRHAIHENYDSIDDAEVAVINSALSGDKEAMKSIPEGVADVISEMRAQIDGLSRYMLEKGWVSGELAAKIDSKIGTYLARSYRIFDDKNYVKNLDPDVFAAAVSFIERKLIKNGVPPAEAQAQALAQTRDLLAKYSGEGGRDLYMRGKLGAKDLSLFTKKKDLAPEITALLGDYKDPIVNYARSVSRMVHFIGRQKLLNDMKQEGMGKIFFEEKDFEARNAAGAHSKIGGKVLKKPDQKGAESKTEYGPLAGLYTTADVAELINNYDEMLNTSLDGVLGFIAKLNVITKSAATLGSVMTHSRNLIGQLGFAMMNGLLHRVKWKDVRNAVSASWAAAAGSDQAFQEYYNKMTRLGLTGEEATTSELRRVLEEHNKFLKNSESITEMFDKGLGIGLKRLTGKSLRGVQQFYRASDEIGKMVIFEAEKRRLSSLPTYASWSEAKIEKLAAERVRGSVPTYSEIPPAVRKLRMQPAVGPFMSFAYESMRTQINNLRYAKEEYDNGNYGYAAERFAGHMFITFGLSMLIKYASEVFGGVSEEEQEDFRSMLPFYERNADIYFSRDTDGELTYRVLSYNNPYSSTTSSMLALMGFYGKLTDEGIVDHVAQASKAVFEPFTSETMLAQAYIDWSRNTNQYGGRVYNPQASSNEIAWEFIKNFGKPFLPGTAQRAWRRWYEAYTGKTLRSGEKPVLSNELMAEITGVKWKTVDYREKLMFAGFSNNSELSDANRLFNYVAGSRGEASANEMLDAYADANRSRLKIFKNISRQINAARLSGLDDSEIARALIAGKMSKQDVAAIMRGRYVPMKPSPAIIKRARDAGHPVPMKGIGSLMRQYSRVRID